jgi:uncharacterized protein
MISSSSFSWALVTGSSSGIGEALVYLLASRGINLIIHGRNIQKLNEIADALRQKVEVQIINADLSNLSERMSVIESIHEKTPDLVINNAGFGLYGEALTYETSEQLKMLEVNGNAVLQITLEAARTLISAKKQGVILNVSSAAAFSLFPCLSVYSATKAFVNQFSTSLDEETRSYGVRVLVSCPGMVATKFRSRAGGREDHESKGVHDVMSAQFASEEIWNQIQKQQKLHIFNWKYRLSTLIGCLLPKRWVGKLVRSNIEKRHPPRNFLQVPSKKD